MKNTITKSVSYKSLLYTTLSTTSLMLVGCESKRSYSDDVDMNYMPAPDTFDEFRSMLVYMYGENRISSYDKFDDELSYINHLNEHYHEGIEFHNNEGYHISGEEVQFPDNWTDIAKVLNEIFQYTAYIINDFQGK